MKMACRVLLGCTVALLVVLAASCSSTAEGPTIEIRDGSWIAVPPTVEAGGGSFSVTVINLGTEPREFAVVTLWRGEPDALPMRNGQLDLRLDQPFAETVHFDVVHPDYERQEGEGVEPGPLIPDTIDPGEEKSVTIGGFEGGGEPGTYVVLSHEPGRYEAGEYAAFSITDG